MFDSNNKPTHTIKNAEDASKLSRVHNLKKHEEIVARDKKTREDIDNLLIPEILKNIENECKYGFFSYYLETEKIREDYRLHLSYICSKLQKLGFGATCYLDSYNSILCVRW
jgi:hypothetical protein